MRKKALIILILILILTTTGCLRTAPQSPVWLPGEVMPDPTAMTTSGQTATPSFHLLPTRDITSPLTEPTPDIPHLQPTLRTDIEQYIVLYGDTLNEIARRYSISVELLMKANDLIDPNNISVGQLLQIPAQSSSGISPANKIIPDSELVYGPMSITFDINSMIQKKSGYLAHFQQDVDGSILDAAQIITLISQNYSVNPRLLLAILEYRSGWLSNPQAGIVGIDSPLGFQDNWYSGLYRQLAWAANTLNRGYYLWKADGLTNVILTDGNIFQLADNINSGTASVQYLFSKLDNTSEWEKDISPEGFYKLYSNLYGYPFDLAIEPLVPKDLIQPHMILPFEVGDVWAFTGGPHGGWDTGSAWAALDFAPPGEAQGCVPSNAWVTSVADGTILRAKNGAVIQDLDNDGFEQTGWVVLYMHIETLDRVAAGTFVRAGERIGHPSCEGGESTGTHVHLARRFNGEWISADGQFPFNLGSWISSGNGVEYDGLLTSDGKVVEAFNGNNPINQISR